MIIKLAIKSINKTRGIELFDYNILDNLNTLKDLIENLVDIEIDKYENKEIRPLNQDQLDEMIIQGKISFGFKYRDSEIDRKNAKNVAILAFKDNLFAVFINDKQINNIDEKIKLENNDILSLIRFTMLTGRYY